eukprot:GSChrysophyteH1.ASY1.ANO1.3075.1 assembled CDS
MVNTMPYGGGLWHSWFDRDLGIAGRCIIKEKDGGISARLVRIDDPVARIPNLAIHLTSGEERTSFSPNLQEHCKAILSMDPEIVSLEPTDDEKEVSSRLHPVLLRMMADQLGVDVGSIEDMELQLIDTQPSAIGGAGGELLFSVQATQKGVHMTMFFDHEEVGSQSPCGAGSGLFLDTIKSFVVSIDMAHAKHPNYQSKHDSTMAPRINQGLVVKTNANMRYATNSVSATMFRQLAKMVGCPVQEFSVRSDTGCGSTIGPIISTLSGILTIDVGTPQFSMHSIREMMGSEDAYIGYIHLKSVLMNYAALQAKSSWD